MAVLTSPDISKAKQSEVVRALMPHVNNLLLNMARADHWREVMDQIDADLISAYDLRDANGIRVKPSTTYLADAPDQYWIDRQKAVDQLGLDLPEEHCPALSAEQDMRDSQRELINASTPFFGFTHAQIMGSRDAIAKLEKAASLLIGLVVNSPDYVRPEL